MTVKLIMVTYDGDKRIEEKWSDIPDRKQKEIGAELTASFMKAAGFTAEVPA